MLKNMLDLSNFKVFWLKSSERTFSLVLEV